MAEPSTSSSLVPKIIVAGLVLLVALTVLGWVIGAILGILRFLVVVAIVGGVLWALLVVRGDDD